MGLRGFFDAPTKIAAQPDKDFGELVRQRRRKRGLPVALAGKVLPFLPVCRQNHAVERAAIDVAAEVVLADNPSTEEVHRARLRLAERRMDETLLELEEASLQ